jgi:hypothetical protein
MSVRQAEQRRDPQWHRGSELQSLPENAHRTPESNTAIIAHTMFRAWLPPVVFANLATYLQFIQRGV